MHCRTAALAIALLAVACGAPPPPAAPPSPARLTRDAVGHFCGMIVAEHQGPKGQIHLEDRPQPLWFSSVRDTIAFTRLPEESKAIRAIYVNDMARAESWASPEPWIAAEDAHYAIGSARRGGMGASEAVPFSSRAAAAAFTEAHGGRIVTLDAIPTAYVLGPAPSDEATRPDPP